MGPFDFFNPGAVDTSWANGVFSDPRVQSGLLQAGISLLQPPSFGDTTGAQIGRAIGAAGEAYGRQEEEARKQADTESKSSVRESRAALAEARAANAGANVTARQGQLELQRDRMGMQEILQSQRRHRDALNTYQRYAQEANKAKILDPAAPGALPFDKWAAANGYGDVAAGPRQFSTGVDHGDNSGELQDAQDALAKGANPDAVRKRYQERTGQKAPF